MANEPALFYYCDSEKNTECSKKHCHINGGDCWMTRNIAFATDDLRARLIVPTDPEMMRDIYDE